MLAQSRHPNVAAIATAVTTAAMAKDLGRRSQSASGKEITPVTAAVKPIWAIENFPESTAAATMRGGYGRRGLRRNSPEHATTGAHTCRYRSRLVADSRNRARGSRPCDDG